MIEVIYKYTCDRCGKVVESNEPMPKALTTVNFYKEHIPVKFRDGLCQKCADKIEKKCVAIVESVVGSDED